MLGVVQDALTGRDRLPGQAVVFARVDFQSPLERENALRDKKVTSAGLRGLPVAGALRCIAVEFAAVLPSGGWSLPCYWRRGFMMAAAAYEALVESAASLTDSQMIAEIDGAEIAVASALLEQNRVALESARRVLSPHCVVPVRHEESFWRERPPYHCLFHFVGDKGLG